MNTTLDFMQEIQNDFFVEAMGLLENTEHCYLEIEKNPSDKKMLEEIFRCVHTIKGSGASVGFPNLAAFAHEIENLLARLKNSSIKINSQIVDLLLKCNDRLANFLKSLSKDKNSSIATEDLVWLINQEIKGQDEKIRNVDFEKHVEKSDMGATKNFSEPKKLGEILVDNKTITEAQLEIALEIQHRKLGDILVDEGLVEKKELALALDAQERINKAASKKQEDYVRLPLSKIDNMLDYFGEQVILLSTLDYANGDLEHNGDLLSKTILQLGKITHDLQQSAMSLRMVNLHTLFSKMQRIVRDVSLSMGKQIVIHTSGEEIELDKNIIDELSGPLTHLVRNAVDHGIETPEVRKSLGKPETGTVKLTAYQKGGFFYLEIMDDGKGLDLGKIRKKAIATGFLKESQPVTSEDLHKLIFINGFSTKDKVSEVSGRGVGMDVVKRAIDSLRGSISLSSTQDKGSIFTVKLPLTLAIFNGMIVRLADMNYIIPNSEIKEIVKIGCDDIRKINSSEKIIKIKDQVMNILDTKKIFKITQSENGNGNNVLIVVSNNGKDYAILVDEIISHHKVVLKKLGAEIEGLPGVAGGTILGDGRVAIILDINDLVNLTQQY